MKVLGYVRVSTEHQVDAGYSLESQRQDIVRYCELYKLDLIEIISDKGLSACNLSRGGLQKVLGMLRSGSADGLIVAKLDRLTRSVRDLSYLLEKYFTIYTLMSVADKIDTGSASGRLVLNIIMSVAQWEREAISERVKKAMGVKKGNNERVGGIPYGKRLSFDGVHLEDHPDEQIVISACRNMKDDMTYRDICKQLNRAGNLNRQGKPFTLSAIHRMANDGKIKYDMEQF